MRRDCGSRAKPAAAVPARLDGCGGGGARGRSRAGTPDEAAPLLDLGSEQAGGCREEGPMRRCEPPGQSEAPAAQEGVDYVDNGAPI